MATPLTNLVVRVSLPKGMATMNGAFLAENLSLEVIADLAPFYASVPQCRLEGGPYMAKIKDTTIAAQIYQSSKEADQKQELLPVPGSHMGNRFYPARNFWVINNAVYSLLVSISGLIGYTGGRVLANFSVTKQRGEQGTGFSAKLVDLKQAMADYLVVLLSGGRVIPGGRAAFSMAAKGLNDDERTPGRTWMTTGMGANATTGEMPSGTGGRGKAVKFFASPICSARYMDARITAGMGNRRPTANAESTFVSSGGIYNTSLVRQAPTRAPVVSGSSLVTAASSITDPIKSIAIITLQASGPLTAFSAIAFSAGKAVVADNLVLAQSLSVLGVSTTGALDNGDTLSVQSKGPIQSSTWNWTPTAPVYLGTAGALTQILPSAGFLQVVGTAIDATTLLIDIKPAIQL